MERPAMNVAAARSAQHQRSRCAPKIMRLRDHVADLVHGARDEIHELKFRNGAHAGERSAKRRSDNGRFGDRRIDHALRTKTINKSFSNFERAAVNPDVFANAKDVWMAFHFFRDSLANSFEVSEYRHKLIRPGCGRHLWRRISHFNRKWCRIELADREAAVGFFTAGHLVAQDALIPPCGYRQFAVRLNFAQAVLHTALHPGM